MYNIVKQRDELERKLNLIEHEFEYFLSSYRTLRITGNSSEIYTLENKIQNICKIFGWIK